MIVIEELVSTIVILEETENRGVLLALYLTNTEQMSSDVLNLAQSRLAEALIVAYMFSEEDANIIEEAMTWLDELEV